MKTRSVIVVAAVLAALSVVVAMLVLVRAAEDRVTADLAARVDVFAIPPAWKLESEVIRPERFLCTDTNPCPSIYRRWNVGGTFTVDDLEKVSSSAGFNMSVKGTCVRPPTAGGITTACSSSGNEGEYSYEMKLVSPGKEKPLVLVLTVEPHLQDVPSPGPVPVGAKKAPAG